MHTLNMLDVVLYQTFDGVAVGCDVGRQLGLKEKVCLVEGEVGFAVGFLVGA